MGTNNNLINATINCDCFIVPNKAVKANSGWDDRPISSWGRKLADKAAEIAAENGFSYNESIDKFVQMWWVGADSDNMQDHGFCIEIGNNKYFFGYQRSISQVPMKFFEGHKEGEILPLVMTLKPMSVMNIELGRKSLQHYEETDEVPEFKITFNLKLNQLDYRYRRFGTFEEVLKYVA